MEQSLSTPSLLSKAQRAATPAQPVSLSNRISVLQQRSPNSVPQEARSPSVPQGALTKSAGAWLAVRRGLSGGDEASRAALELKVALYERERKRTEPELARAHAEVKSLRERLSQVSTLAEEQATQAASDIQELKELRRLRSTMEDAIADARRGGPSEAQWRSLREGEAQLAREREAREEAMRAHEAKLKAGMDAMSARLAAAVAREEEVCAKAAAAAKAMQVVAVPHSHGHPHLHAHPNALSRRSLFRCNQPHPDRYAGG